MAGIRHEDVLGLQVPMDDAFLMGRGEAPGDLQRVVDRLHLDERAAVEPRAKGVSLEKLRHGVGNAPGVAELVDRQDVRMRQRGHGFRLALEARVRFRVEREVLRKNLDRDLAVEGRVAGPVDLSHPSGPDRRKHLVVSEVRAGGERHGSGGLYLAPFRPSTTYMSDSVREYP